MHFENIEKKEVWFDSYEEAEEFCYKNTLWVGDIEPLQTCRGRKYWATPIPYGYKFFQNYEVRKNPDNYCICDYHGNDIRYCSTLQECIDRIKNGTVNE